MSTRTRNAKKPTARKPRAPKPTTPTTTVLPTRKPLAHREFISPIQMNAAFTAAQAGVTYTRITGWEHQADGSALYAMPSGAFLTYQPFAAVPLTAFTVCAHGIRHPHPVTTPRDLHDAQHDAASCTGHTQADERPLADQLTRPGPSNEDTQTTDVTTPRAANADDTAKEHPHD